MHITVKTNEYGYCFWHFEKRTDGSKPDWCVSDTNSFYPAKSTGKPHANSFWKFASLAICRFHTGQPHLSPSDQSKNVSHSLRHFSRRHIQPTMEIYVYPLLFRWRRSPLRRSPANCLASVWTLRYGSSCLTGICHLSPFLNRFCLHPYPGVDEFRQITWRHHCNSSPDNIWISSRIH